jgi:hypothetical protein
MNQGPAPSPIQARFDREHILAFSRLLSQGASQFESSVNGGSMGSALPDDSRIRGQFVNLKDLMRGQVLTYVAKDRIVAHRFLRSATWHQEQYFITRGDTTVCCDIPTPASSVICVVTEVYKDGQWEPVSPPQASWFGFRWTAYVISELVATLVCLNPGFAIWTAQRLIRTHRFASRLTRFVKRHMAGLLLAGTPRAR